MISVGRSRVVRTSKVQALPDDRGRPVALTLTPGNTADIAVAPFLLGRVTPPRRVLGDKAYDTDAFRAFLQYKKIDAVIPSSARRKRPYPLDQEAYRRRNVIERMFCRLKDWRLIATI